jgi:hypothetical protein
MIYDWCRGRMNRDQEVVKRKGFVCIVTIYIEYNLTPNMKQETFSTCFPLVMYVVLLMSFEFSCQNKDHSYVGIYYY